MTTSDTNLQQLIINELTQAQYEALTPAANQLYLTPDTTEQDIADAISTHNSSSAAHNNMQANSVKDQNTGSLKFWSGTQAQYDAITTKDSDTLYNITDADTQDYESTRSIGQVIPSLLPLTDAGLHLLDGSLIRSGGIYSDFVDYISNLYTNTTQKYSNVNIVGTLSDVGGVLSGFTTTNYATIAAPFAPMNNTWEMIFKIKMASSATTGTMIGCGYSWAINRNNMLYLSSNGSSWDIANDAAGITTFQANTTYWFKLIFTGTQYVLYSSTTGTFSGEQVTEVTVSSSTKIHSGNTITLGTWAGGDSAEVEVDLNESYININGSRWWTGRQPICFTDEPIWQGMVSTYGSCGTFVYDSINNTVRLPKLTGFIEGTIDKTKIGSLIQAGLPNITGFQDWWLNGSGTNNPTGAYANALSAQTGWIWNATQTGTPNPHAVLHNFDASRCSSIYGNSNTVQPQSTQVLYYIVVSTVIKTPVQLSIDSIVTDLGDKADKNLDNLNSTGKAVVCNLPMPSARYDVLVAGASGTTYTAPADGWFTCGISGTPGSSYFEIVNYSTGDNGLGSTAANLGGWGRAICPAKKGDPVTIWHNSPTVETFCFVYAQGETQ